MKHLHVCICTLRRVAAVLFVAATLNSVALSQSGFWESLNGPEGGVCQCFADDNQGNILTGTYFGGVYKTTNRGGSWNRLSYGNWDVRTIVVNPSDHIFIGAAAAGVWRSTDGGTTWVQPPNIVNGRTVTSLAFTSSGNLIATCANNTSQSVFQSTDNGETFYHVSSGLFSGNSVIREGNNMYAAGERNGVLRSTDGGFLWTIINPSSALFNGLSMTANANYVYVTGTRTAATTPDSSFIYRRSIATGNWELVHIQSSAVLRTISSIGDTLVAAGDTTVLVSFDAGQTWIERSPLGPNAGPVVGLANFFSSYCGRDVQLGGCGGRSIALSNDFWLNWTQSSQGLQNTHIIAGAVLPSNKMLVSAQFDGLYLIDGTTTTRAPGDGLPTLDVVTVFASDNTGVYAGTSSNGLWKSTNEGTTFQQVLYGTDATGIGRISTRIPGLVLAGGKGEYLHASTNAGLSWTSRRLPNGVTTNITGIAPRVAGEYYVSTGAFAGSGSGNGVYKTTNAGLSWTHHGLLFSSLTGLDISDDDRLLGGALGVAVEGSTSTPLWTTLPDFDLGTKLRVSGFYKLPNEPLREMAGTSTGFYDRLAGTSDPWTKRVLGDLESSLVYIRNVGGLGPTSFPGQVILGTYGGGLFQSISTLTSVHENENIPGDFSLEQNYPNPFNPGTRIVYRVKIRQPVSLKAFDVLGREVAVLVDEVKEPGEYTIAWEASGLSSGVYFYRLTAGPFTETRKLVLMK